MLVERLLVGTTQPVRLVLQEKDIAVCANLDSLVTIVKKVSDEY